MSKDDEIKKLKRLNKLYLDMLTKRDNENTRRLERISKINNEIQNRIYVLIDRLHNNSDTLLIKRLKILKDRRLKFGLLYKQVYIFEYSMNS